MVLVALSLVAGAAPPRRLVMPLTPSTLQDAFGAAAKKKGAGTVPWTSDTPGFSCEAEDDWVQVWVRRPTWPGQVPDRVHCSSEIGTVRFKVVINDEQLESMFVGDGTLVLARAPGESAAFKGAPPRNDLAVEMGKTGTSGIHCEIRPGPELVVRASDDLPDVVTRCELRTLRGEPVQFPLVLRTAPRAGG